ncbi:dimethylsulfonioproprionate lyase family protein [Roseibium sp. SCPC15]|jgi:mannose-6-phosphate isomerase-like protein (cupin superfamily)|uniref:dimethylsulfonioproprionate lyase family protein n=1 Tax=Roseibium sp. SCP15 TaxID=3141376 RepID=UPI003338CD13
MSRDAFDRLLTAVRTIYESDAELGAFAPWPSQLDWAEIEAENLPVARHVGGWLENDSSAMAELHQAIAAAAPKAAWRLTYTEEEVGAHFLENYGYFELFGPSGHFRTEEGRVYIAYWGPELFYDWHHHEAEELYVIVSGLGEFHRQDGMTAVLGRGATRFHQAWQRHAMTTRNEGILTLIFWRGSGLSGLPHMERRG